MENKDQDKLFAIALALYRAQQRRVDRARDAVLLAEEKFARLQKAEEEARVRLEKAQAEEKERQNSDE